MKKAHIRCLLGTLGILLISHFYPSQNEISQERPVFSKRDRMDLAMAQEYEMTHDPATGEIPKEALREAYLYAERLRAQNDVVRAAIPDLNWIERGPNNFGGRTRTIMVDPNDPSHRTVWAAGVAGGLWKTADITASPPVWQNIDDFFGNLAITTLTHDPVNSQVMYFGTGEGYYNSDAMRGMGVWKSTDGGASWSPLAATQNSAYHYCYRLLMVGQDTILAATSSGLRRSTNGGTSWTKVLGGSGVSNNIYDVEMAADGRIFASPNGGIHISSDRGATFGGALSLPVGAERIELGCAPSDANYVYALVERSNQVEAILRSTDGGLNWNMRSEPNDADGGISNTDFSRGQAWYDLTIAVDPNNRDVVLVGGVDLFRTNNGGLSWQQISHWWGGYGYQEVHADQHFISFQPGSSDVIYFGNDGGIYVSYNGNNNIPTIQRKNEGYRTLQFYACAMHPTADQNHFLAGSQDNGSHKFSTLGLGNTIEVTGGDGAFCHIDQDQPAYQFTSYVYNNYFRSNNGGNSFSSSNHGNNGRFINPTDYDNDANILYGARNSNEYLRWDNPQSGSSFTTVNAGFGNQVSAVTCDPHVSHRVYFGIGNGRIYRVDNAHTNSPNLLHINNGAGMPGGYVSCIEVEGGNTNHLLVTYSSYGVNSVWETPDGGITWQSVEGNLPNIPVRWALFHPQDSSQAMLGTELGVWSTGELNGGATDWGPSSNGLANTRVEMLQYRSSDRLVIAATHGRGLFSTDVFMDPQAKLGGDSRIGYVNKNVQFNDYSVKATSWLWDFGDGNISSVQDPLHSYASPGLYTVSLAINGGVDTDVQSNYIHILPDKATPYIASDGGDFETHVLDFAPESISGTPFERGSSAIIGKQGTFSGSNAWVTGIAPSNYTDLTDARLYTPNYDLSLLGVYTLRFRSRFYTEPSYDGFRLEYSTNKGDSWLPLGITGTQANWYNFANSASTTSFPLNTSFFTGNGSNAFNEYYYDVTFLSGNPDVAFRFRLKTDPYVTAPGVAIDNFEIDNYLLAANLVAFEGKWENRAAMLQWAAETDGSSEIFTLERSSTGSDFEEVAQVPFAQEDGVSTYEYLDKEATLGLNYYRIRWHDVNGATAFSKTITLTRPENGFSIYPNPASDFVNIQLDFDAEVRLVNMKGQVLKQVKLDQGKHPISLNEIPEGVYLVEILSTTGQKLSSKLVVR